MINMDDLPEALLAEILYDYRVPCPKSLFRCKSVSKRWFHLISAPYFVRRLKQKPIVSTLIVEATDELLDPPLFEFLPMCEITSSLSVNFYINTAANVEGTYNDLILCNYHWGDADCYSICNPYTKQWLYLPPIPEVQGELVELGLVYKGFLCDPLNPQRWNFVLLVPVSRGSAFHLQVWSSETREWRESVISVPYPQAIRPLPQSKPSYGGVAYNGMLYWICWDDSAMFTIEFDPFGSDDISDHKCRFIDGPGFEVINRCSIISVCAFQKCVRVCVQSGGSCFSVWEFKEEVDSVGDKLKKWHLIVDRVSLNQFSQRYSDDGRIVLGFHPTNEDILYIRTIDSIVTYNIRDKTVETAIETPEHLEFCYKPFETVFPFVLPWLPTPVALENYNYQYIYIDFQFDRARNCEAVLLLHRSLHACYLISCMLHYICN